jgi:hypothetical protein
VELLYEWGEAMRKVFIHMENLKDFSWDALGPEDYPFEGVLRNLNGLDIAFIRPVLKRSIVNGVYIQDRCIGFDRRFTAHRNSLLNIIPNNLMIATEILSSQPHSAGVWV